ncbi:GIY-YIG nuclease family protein [Micavibrio aeruginosavorus]|uniref:Excinuclease ABC, C subunit domain protein n=1 Tax=Micavibrio aeruginosavorus EPB TaxID=349215 RepID=M4VHM9_9BACT|nr:GIY-YIG nuclease family protein [Micavibrio aeruginosavorus]AGH97541.1 Excinuclease ABC, C subunit domain protein [Micavibrio aeruginosavorus EPB]
MKQYYFYILASDKVGTLYVGVTSDLKRRVAEHKEKLLDGFTKQYGVSTLVYYEVYDDPEKAILREKRVKKWNRNWKLELIQKTNPDWTDLYDTL